MYVIEKRQMDRGIYIQPIESMHEVTMSPAGVLVNAY
jgi:hypothetical protein